MEMSFSSWQIYELLCTFVHNIIKNEKNYSYNIHSGSCIDDCRTVARHRHASRPFRESHKEDMSNARRTNSYCNDGNNRRV